MNIEILPEEAINGSDHEISFLDKKIIISIPKGVKNLTSLKLANIKEINNVDLFVKLHIVKKPKTNLFDKLKNIFKGSAN